MKGMGECLRAAHLPSMLVMLPFRNRSAARTVLAITTTGRRNVHVWNHEDPWDCNTPSI